MCESKAGRKSNIWKKDSSKPHVLKKTGSGRKISKDRIISWIRNWAPESDIAPTVWYFPPAWDAKDVRCQMYESALFAY